MRKKLQIIYLFIFSFMFLVNRVYAAGYDLSVTSNTLTVGNSVTLNIKATDAAGKFSITSSNNSVVSVSSSSVWLDNESRGITLKANKEGSAIITVTANDVTDYNGGAITGSKTINIVVKAKQTTSNNGTTNRPVAPKSSNNFLTSITVDGLTLKEKFDKETLEYNVEVPAETEKIKINAQLADSTASIKGTGEVSVTPGLNTFEIEVTAANGSKRIYKLNATVLELEPIIVTIDKEKYTVVRKRKELPKISEYFEEKDININDDKIEGYYNQKLNYNIIGLKDSKGNIEYYIYNDNKYTLYKEHSFNGIVLQIIDKEINNYKKTSFKYDNDEIISYQEIKPDLIKNTYALNTNDVIGNQFYLFYAKNVENGEENLYQYDKVEKTVQRYNIEIIDMYKDRVDTYYMYILLAILVIGILIVTIATLLITNSKRKKEIKLIKSKNEVSNKSKRRKKVEDEEE